MIAKLLKTIFPLKFSSKESYRIYRQQRNGYLEALKVIENNGTGGLAGINTWTDRASFAQGKQTEINFSFWILLPVSVTCFYLA